jgi:hypothetical protein
MKNCPHCGAEDALESVLRIDLDDVELEPNPADASTAHWAKWRVKDFVPARSANDPNTGIVFEEAHVSCRECGETLDEVDIPWRFADRWRYTRSPLTTGDITLICTALDRFSDYLTDHGHKDYSEGVPERLNQQVSEVWAKLNEQG